MKDYYLAKLGKIHGPFKESEIQRMQKEGEIQQYAWIWKAEDSSWKAIDPAPEHAPTILSQIQESVSAFAWEGVLYNGMQVMSGNIDSRTETGCEMLSWHEEPYPSFHEGAWIVLSILDVHSGQVCNLPAQVCGSLKEGSVWRYRLRWSEPPHFESQLHKNFS